MFGITNKQVNLFVEESKKTPPFHFHTAIYTQCALTLWRQKLNWNILPPTAHWSILNPISNKRGGFPLLPKLQFSRTPTRSSYLRAGVCNPLHRSGANHLLAFIIPGQMWFMLVAYDRKRAGQLVVWFMPAGAVTSQSLFNYCKRQGQPAQFMRVSGRAPLSPPWIFQR